MRRLSFPIVLLGGLLTAAGSIAQEPGEPDVGGARAVGPHMSMPSRAESIRGETMRGQSLRAPPATFQPPPEQFDQQADPRQHIFEERARRNRNSDFSPQTLRDPRSINYRSRAWHDEPPDRNVPRDLQRAIEQAQAEHGGKVLSADRIRYRGQDTYRVKLLTPSGRVRVVQMSEQSARQNEQTEATAPEDQRKGDE